MAVRGEGARRISYFYPEDGSHMFSKTLVPICHITQWHSQSAFSLQLFMNAVFQMLSEAMHWHAVVFISIWNKSTRIPHNVTLYTYFDTFTSSWWAYLDPQHSFSSRLGLAVVVTFCILPGLTVIKPHFAFDQGATLVKPLCCFDCILHLTSCQLFWNQFLVLYIIRTFTLILRVNTDPYTNFHG